VELTYENFQPSISHNARWSLGDSGQGLAFVGGLLGRSRAVHQHSIHLCLRRDCRCAWGVHRGTWHAQTHRCVGRLPHMGMMPFRIRALASTGGCVQGKVPHCPIAENAGALQSASLHSQIRDYPWCWLSALPPHPQHAGQFARAFVIALGSVGCGCAVGCAKRGIATAACACGPIGAAGQRIVDCCHAALPHRGTHPHFNTCGFEWFVAQWTERNVAAAQEWKTI